MMATAASANEHVVGDGGESDEYDLPSATAAAAQIYATYLESTGDGTEPNLATYAQPIAVGAGVTSAVATDADDGPGGDDRDRDAT
jgi:hypothetical protein